MKYIYEDFVNNDDIAAAEGQGYTINVRFCRDCPCFEANYWQKDPTIVSGWCKRLSYYRTFDDEAPHYVYVNSNSFCNEDDIEEIDE